MNINQVFQLLLNSLSLKQHKLNLSWAAVNLWNEGVLNVLVEAKLLVENGYAENVQCQGCEKYCTVGVTKHVYPNSIRYYAACDDPVMHEQMGRMTIPAVQVKQWQTSIKRLANVIAGLLELSPDISYKADQTCIKLGLVKSKNGRRSIVLNVEPLTLVVNQIELPVHEILFFENNLLKLDREKLNGVLNVKQSNATKRYTPNIDKREQSKAKTQAMYQDWQDAYEKLKKDKPNKPNKPKKTKGRYAYEISKMPIAQGRTVANIVRNLKN